MKPIVVSLLALATALLPSIAAQVDQCSTPSPDPILGQAPTQVITGALAYMATGGCNNVAPLFAPIPACPASATVAQWCSGMWVDATAGIECTWSNIAGSVFDYAIGVDKDLDGNILAGSPDSPLYRTGLPNTFPAPNGAVFGIQFHSPVSGRLIAYPLSILPTGSATDVSMVQCVTVA